MSRKRGSTVSGIEATGGVDYAIEVYRKAGGGSAGRRAVERYLHKTYPSAGQDTRDAVQRRVKAAIDLAGRYQRGGDNYSHERPRSGAARGGGGGGGSGGSTRQGRSGSRYTYNVEIESTVRNEDGSVEIKSHRVTIFSSSPLTNRQIHEQAQADYHAWVAVVGGSDEEFAKRYEGTRVVASRVMGVY